MCRISLKVMLNYVTIVATRCLCTAFQAVGSGHDRWSPRCFIESVVKSATDFPSSSWDEMAILNFLVETMHDNCRPSLIRPN